MNRRGKRGGHQSRKATARVAQRRYELRLAHDYIELPYHEFCAVHGRSGWRAASLAAREVSR